MRRLTYAETNDMRRQYGKTVLLFLTDRCPVGCAHCSVDSRADSPMVTDYALFEELVAGIAEAPLPLVGISGGEPFVERRALPLAVDRFRGAGKDVVVYTSGYWASGPRLQPWIAGVLRQTSTVFLSTDSFHQGSVSRERFRRAAGHIADAGCHIVSQVLDETASREFVTSVFSEMFGADWERHADVVPTPPLPHGRGRNVFQITKRHVLAAFGPCMAASAPTIRYDGLVIGCCNESMIMGAGPEQLRRRVRSRADLAAALEWFRTAPLLRAVATVPLAEVGRLPGFTALDDRRYDSICQACWRAHDMLAEDPRAGVVIAGVWAGTAAPGRWAGA
jgi:hypothetical protein